MCLATDSEGREPRAAFFGEHWAGLAAEMGAEDLQSSGRSEGGRPRSLTNEVTERAALQVDVTWSSDVLALGPSLAGGNGALTGRCYVAERCPPSTSPARNPARRAGR
jgi:hypothetical protein